MSSLYWAFKSSQPLPRILNLSYPRVSILPEGEEFLVVLYGFGDVASLFIDLAKNEMGFGVNVTFSTIVSSKS